MVDDGSTDDTQIVLKTFAGSVKNIQQANLGVCAARNRGVAESQGDYLAFLDSDDIWEPTKIEKQIGAFEKDPQIGLVHCGMREFDSETGETVSMHLDGAVGNVARNLLLWEEPSIVGPGGTIMVSRAAFDVAGGFDPRIVVGEDWDLCYRIARRYKVGFVPEPLVHYRSHAASAHHNVAAMAKGMALFYEKAFAEGDEQVRSLKRRAMANFHRTLSGSFFHTGQYGRSISHAIRGLLNRPSSIGYFLKVPFRARGPQ